MPYKNTKKRQEARAPLPHDLPPPEPPWKGCNKTSFSKVFIGTPEMHQRLQSYLQKVHLLSSHATHALKYFVLASPQYPVITRTHVEAILYLVNKGLHWTPRSEERQLIRNNLCPYVQSYMDIVQMQHVNLDNDCATVEYLSKSIITNLETNVKCHFVTVCTYISALY